MKIINQSLGESWRTSLIGLGLIALGAWAFKVHWVPSQTIYFNLMYVELAPIAVMASGVVAILTREQRAHDKTK